MRFGMLACWPCCWALRSLIFSPSRYVKARLTKKYSEEYRNEYGFTEKEWYGEYKIAYRTKIHAINVWIFHHPQKKFLLCNALQSL